MTPSPAADTVIVVGGGLAGLTAARRLALQGARVALLEASDRVGGQLMRHTIGGIPLDAGADAFSTRGGAVEKLAASLGLSDDIVAPTEAPTWVHRSDGTAVPLPATSLLGIPGIPLAADVVAAIGARAAWRAQLESLMLGQVGARSRTIGDLVRRRMGRGVLTGLVAPVVRGEHLADPDELEVDVALPGLHAALLRDGNLTAAIRGMRDETARSPVRGIRGGMVRLIEVLAQDAEAFGAELRTGARVTHADPDSVTLESGERLTGRVVMAAPGPGAGPRTGRRVTLITLVVDAPDLDERPRGAGVYVGSGTEVRARALAHITARWDWVARAAAGRHVLRLSYDATDAPDIDAATRDAATLLGVALKHPDDAAIVTWERPPHRTHAVDGMQYVGESVSGTGIAAVVAQADAIQIETGPDDTESHG